MLRCVCGAKPQPLPAPAPAKHDKAYLREHYPKRRVQLREHVHGKKGHYTLGKGKHGTVKAAFSLRHRCDVAIKSQTKQLMVAKGEMELGRALHLKHVVRVLDWAEGPKKSYIVMEQAEPLIADGSPARARALLWDIIEGFQEIHAHDIYHRDIGVYEGEKGKEGKRRSPDTIKNIMLVDGICKMTDIGKMACSPPAALRPLFARADARGLCRVMHAFLKACDPDEAEPFYRWYTTQPGLRVDVVAAHPWLHGKPRPPESGRARALLYPAHVFAEWLTAPTPLLVGRGVPGLPPPGYKPLAGANVFNKRS